MKKITLTLILLTAGLLGACTGSTERASSGNAAQPGAQPQATVDPAGANQNKPASNTGNTADANKPKANSNPENTPSGDRKAVSGEEVTGLIR
jgi:hypothetical protein